MNVDSSPYPLLKLHRPLGYERVYLQLCKVTDTPFHIQGCGMCTKHHSFVSQPVVSWSVRTTSVPFLCPPEVTF